MVDTKKILKINDVIFSDREVDIISCISNGLTAKDAGLLLNISHHTVNTHIRNIMQKMASSSRGQIIKFLELSDQYMVVHNRYINLIVSDKFKKLLKHIASISKQKSKECVLHLTKDSQNTYQGVYTNLVLSGIDVTIDFCKSMDFYLSDNKFHVFCVSENTSIDLSKKRKNVITLQQVNDNIILYGQYFTSNANYYLAVLSCIEQIYESSKVTLLIDDFKKYCKSKQFLDFNENILSNIEEERSNSKLIYYSILCAILVCIVSPYVFWISNQKHTAFNIQLVNESRILSRPKIIEQISDSFDNQKGIKFVLLTGEGGIGKTTTARHYLHLKKFKIKWEIDAETEYKIMESFNGLAAALAKTKQLEEALAAIQLIQSKEDKKRRLAMFVFSQLKSIGDWCLLFDNVDSFELIKPFIPLEKEFSGDGQVILTTRNENLKNIIYFHENSTIKIPTLSSKEQSELFCGILFGAKAYSINKCKKNEVTHFLKNIPGMPLDTTIVAQYIKINHVSLNDFKKLMRETDFYENSNKILTFNDYHETRYSIIATAFNKIIQECEENKELLFLLCWLDSQNIPIEYFKAFKNFKIIDNFFHHLHEHSIITEENSVFSIHRSTQKNGLKFLIKILSNAEKERYINNIISFMTRYKELLPGWYKTNTEPKTIQYKTQLIPHLQSLLANLDICSREKHVRNERKIKILITLLYANGDIPPPTEMQNLGDEIIRLNSIDPIIKDYDLAMLFLYNALLCTNCGRTIKCKEYAQKCVDLSGQLQNAENLLATGLALLSRYGFSYHDKQSLNLLDKSLMIIEKVRSNYPNGAVIAIANQYYRYFGTNCINKSGTHKAVQFLLKTLQTFGCDSQKIGEILLRSPDIAGIIDMKMNLVRGYNRTGNFDEALKNIDSIESLYEKLEKIGIQLYIGKARLNVEKGFALLIKGEIEKANETFTKIVKSELLADVTDMFYLLSYRSETFIRLGKFKEAYEDCVNALKNKESCFDSNYARLTACTCYYNMAVAKCRMNDLAQSRKLLNIFFEKAEQFCRLFLEEDQFAILNNRRTFTAHESLKQDLLESAEIFEIIYGKDHSFVKDYVQCNLLK